MKIIKYLGYCILFFIMNSCTFYSLKGTIPAHINSIYIQPIINQSSDEDINDFRDSKFGEEYVSMFSLYWSEIAKLFSDIPYLTIEDKYTINISLLNYILEWDSEIISLYTVLTIEDKYIIYISYL